MHLHIVGKSLGALLLFLGIGGLGPLGADALTGHPTRGWWVMCAATVVVGTALWLAGRHGRSEDMGLIEGVAVTTLVWLLGSLLAGIGLWLTAPDTPPIDAWFEAMSGLTTTGSTVYGGARAIEDLSPGVLLWRSQLQWIGGIGIVVISLALLPLLIGGGGFKAFRAEVPGLDTDRIAPRIRDTAFILYRFYLGLTLSVFCALVACGVGGFDALCHAMTCVSTGGFSPYDDSIEGLGSAAAEWVLIGGMLLAGCNFGLLLHAAHGRAERLLQSSEFRLYLALIVGGCIALSLLLAAGMPSYDTYHELVRDAVFQVVSIITSTGYATGYDTEPAAWAAWPATAQLILVFLMIGGGCAGSTAGGVKLVRFLVAWRAARRELRRYVEPARVTPVHLGGHRLREPVVLQVGTFIFVYFLSWIIGTLLLSALGSDLTTATTAALSCLSNIGPGLGAVGPAENWAGLTDPAKVVCIALMLLGRLELFGVLLLLRARAWRS